MIPDGYFKAIWLRNPAIPRTLMALESGGNIDALGDSGLAFGLFQAHPDFIETWWPAVQYLRSGVRMDLTLAKALAQAAQGSPIVWRDAVGAFLAAQHNIGKSLEETLIRFHYGHDEPLDPDKYVQRFKAISGAPITW